MRTTFWLILMVPAVAGAHRGLRHDIEQVTAQLLPAPQAELLLRRAALYRRQGAHESSLADLDRAAALGADPAQTVLERGLTLAAMGADADAITALSRSLAHRPSWPALVARARAHARLDRAVAAEADFDAALALRPHVEVFLERGRLQQRVGRLDAAAAGYRAALNALGPAEGVLEALVGLELGRGRPQAALPIIEQALARGPTVSWLLKRAEAQQGAGAAADRAVTLARALELADRAVTRRPSAINLVLRARVRLALGATSDARRDALAALSRAPRYAPARALAARTGGAR
jgi:tetratricopeptide (TPR) repeat protein